MGSDSQTRQSGCPYYFRSAHANPGFLDTVLVPGKGADRPLRSLLQLDVERAEQLQREDRVHTYAGFHIARIA